MVEITTAQWWEPGKPENALSGVLLEDADRGWVLRLDGGFEDPTAGHPQSDSVVTLAMTATNNYPILLGRTAGGRLITLFGCQVLEAGLAFGSSSGFLKIWPTILAYDVHFEGIDDFNLTSLSLRYSNLDAWTATSGFSVGFNAAGFDPVDVRYARPEPINVALTEGTTISISFSVSGPSMPALTAVHIVQSTWVTVTSPEARPYEQLLRTVTIFSDLITLGVGQPVRPLEMAGTCNAQTTAGAPLTLAHFKLTHNREQIAPVLPDVAVWDMLFTLPAIRDRLEDLVRAWFARQERIRPLYDLYFGTVRSPKMYVEHRFLNMFQALESYDRRTFVHAPEKIQAHNERLDRILNAVSSGDKKWLKGCLRRSHEPAAADRIRRLAEKLDAKWLLDDEDVRLAADFRNFYTHFDPDTEQRLPPKEERSRNMYNLAIRLQVLCELTLLDAIGFSSHEARLQMEKTLRVERRLAS